MVPSPSGKAKVCKTFIPSSNLGGTSTSEQSTLCSVFLCQEKHPPAPLLLLIPKKSKDFLGALTWAERSRIIFGQLSHVGAKYALLRSDFSFRKKNQVRAPSFLLFRKKARSARLFACKRTHDGSLSLSTFCDCAPAAQRYHFWTVKSRWRKVRF